jgi:hypothetical protein
MERKMWKNLEEISEEQHYKILLDYRLKKELVPTEIFQDSFWFGIKKEYKEDFGLDKLNAVTLNEQDFMVILKKLLKEFPFLGERIKKILSE